MPKDYKPPPDANDVFTRYKALYEGERELKPVMREMAERELKAGATVGQLARLTGLTPEVFRRMARDLGVERKREPTVGKLTTAPDPTPTRPAAPAPEHPAPPGRLGISAKVAALTYGQAKALFVQTETSHPAWWIERRKKITASGIPAGWQYHVGVQAGVDAEIIDLPERPAGSEENTG